MAWVIIDLKIMPESPDEDLGKIEASAKKLIEETGAKVNSVSRQPIAFGLVALMIKFSADEKKGSTDELEARITDIEGVNSVEVVGVSRALG